MERDSIMVYSGFHSDYSEEIRYFKECKVYSVQIESNLSCPQGCLYCYASSKDAPMKELPRGDVISILDSTGNSLVPCVRMVKREIQLRQIE